MRVCVFLSAAILVALSASPIAPTAEAASRLRAKVVLTQKGIPKALTARGLWRFANSHRAKRLAERRDLPIKKRYWHANLVAAFNAPVGDSEFEVLFYDTEGSQRKFIAPALTVFVSDSKQKTFLHKLRLRRPQFEPNRRMELVVTVRRQEVGRAAFQVIGERIQHTGEVTFSDEEAR